MKKKASNASGQNISSVDQRIIDSFRLKEGEVISGEELSSLLNVSRTAIWKHIQSLKSLGYRIEALPSQGYRLLSSPDLLIPSEIRSGLTTERLGKRIICFTETDSTNSILFKLAEDGAEEGTVVIADAQRRGKGRLGREWISPGGVNLYFSMLLKPDILPVEAYQLTFLSAVAVSRAIERTTSLIPRIKWPNDILVNDRKVAGLLNEMSAETEKVNFVVLGIGINLNMKRDQFPVDIRFPASSLLLEGGSEIGRCAFIRTLITELDDLYAVYMKEGDEPVRKEWLVRCDIEGRTVSVSGNDLDFTGVVSRVDETGGLVVRLPDGREEKVFSGDVRIVNR